MMPIAAMWVATDQSRWLSELIQRTFRRMELSRKGQEAYTGLTEKQFSDQITLKQPLNLWRLADIPEFFQSFMFVLAEEFGYCCYPNDRVRLIIQVDATPRPMLRASLPARKEIA